MVEVVVEDVECEVEGEGVLKRITNMNSMKGKENEFSISRISS